MPRATPHPIVHLTPDGDLVPAAAAAPGDVRLWPFTQHRRLPRRSRHPERLDPINLLVLGATPTAVIASLATQGWSRPDDGATHRTWVDGRFVTMSDHIALGSRSERVHLRVFALAGSTLVGAHHERGGPRGRHRVTSWDRARQAVADALEATGMARIAPTGIVTPPDLRGIASDGRVWRLVAR